MGRNSLEATKASLILWARAARRRRSDGLTYFFLPRGVVADRWVAVDVLRADDELGFLAAVAVDGFLGGTVLDFSGLCGVEVVLSEDPLACESYLFPAIGETVRRAQNTAASIRAGTFIEKGEITGLIDSMYAGNGCGEQRSISTVTFL